METQSDWYHKIAREISPYQDTLTKKDSKKYKLDLLLRVADRVDSFSSACGECQLFQTDINRLTEELGTLVQMPDKEKRRSYNKAIKNIVKHLQKQHNLVTKGQYKEMGMAIGVGVGIALGAVFDNIGAGIGIGTGVGMAVGSYLDKKAKKEGGVI